MTKYESLLSEYYDELLIEERPMISDVLYSDNVIWINEKITNSRKACILAEYFDLDEEFVRGCFKYYGLL